MRPWATSLKTHLYVWKYMRYLMDLQPYAFPFVQ